jgi:hypothetical protein
VKLTEPPDPALLDTIRKLTERSGGGS